MEDSVQQRIRELIRAENLKIYEFEKRIGAANSYVNSIRKSISPYYLESIAKAFPSWNVSWIMTGLGNKFNSADVKSNNKPVQTAVPEEKTDVALIRTIQDMTAVLKSQQQTIENLVTLQLQTERHNNEESKEA